MPSRGAARSLATCFAAALLMSVGRGAVAGGTASAVADVVGGTARTVMARYHIPGMAIGIAAGNHSYIFDYGVAAIASRKPVTNGTLFELGSVTKTLTSSWPTGTIR